MKIYSYSLKVSQDGGHAWPGDNKGPFDTTTLSFCYHSIKQFLSDSLNDTLNFNSSRKSTICERLDAFLLRYGSENTVLFISSTFEYLPTDGKANLADDTRTSYPNTELQ